MAEELALARKTVAVRDGVDEVFQEEGRQCGERGASDE